MYGCSPKFKELFKDCLNRMRNNEYQKFLAGPLLHKKIEWMKEKNKINTGSLNQWKINPSEKNLKK